MKAAIIGAGAIGMKRAAAAKACGMTVKLVADVDDASAERLAKEFGAKTASWQECVKDPDVELIFVCTSHDSLSNIGIAALENGKHVLIEKPAGRSVEEIGELVKAHEAALKKGFVAAKVGYNHRFHPMIQKLQKLIESNALGTLLFMTGEYGHGGREGMEKEWRCQKSVSGGGELLDQGSHLIDLYRLFLGNPVDVRGFAPTYAWKSEDPVEDNCFFILRNSVENIGQFHVSWTMWKNSFQLKVIGTDAVAVISGIGKSYGAEKLTVYKRGAMGKAFSEEAYEGEDLSFINELKYFLDRIQQKKQPEGNLTDALEVMKVVEEIYNDA